MDASVRAQRSGFRDDIGVAIDIGVALNTGTGIGSSVRIGHRIRTGIRVRVDTESCARAGRAGRCTSGGRARTERAGAQG